MKISLLVSNSCRERYLVVSRVVNVDPNPWTNHDPLFIKPLLRGTPNERAKQKPQPQSPLSTRLGPGLRWVRPPKNTTLSQSQRSSRVTRTDPTLDGPDDTNDPTTRTCPKTQTGLKT